MNRDPWRYQTRSAAYKHIRRRLDGKEAMVLQCNQNLGLSPRQRGRRAVDEEVGDDDVAIMFKEQSAEVERFLFRHILEVLGKAASFPLLG